MHELTPLEAVNRLWHRKYWVLATVFTCLLLSGLYLQHAEQLFDVHANLLLEPNAHGLRVDKDDNSRPNAELIATQSEILASRQLLSRAVGAQQERSAEKSLNPEALVHRLSSELTVRRVVGTRILNISLRWDDQEQGRAFVEHLIEQYERFLFELNQGGQIKALATLAQTERAIRGELTTLQKQFRELRKESSLVGDGDAGLAPQQTLLAKFGAAYAELRGRRLGLENRLAAINEQLAELSIAASPVPAASDPNLADVDSNPADSELISSLSWLPGRDRPVIHAGYTAIEQGTPTVDSTERGWGALQMLNDVDLRGLQDPIAIQQELFLAEVRRQELVEKYLEKHPEVRAVESQIAGWKQRLQTLVDRAPLTLERELRAAKQQEDRLRALYEEELATVKKLDEHRLEQMHLANEIAQVQTLHNSFLTQLSELRLNNQVASEGGADLRVTVLDPPMAGLKPAWPNKKLVLGGGLLVGLLGSFMLMLIPDHSARGAAIADLPDSNHRGGH